MKYTKHVIRELLSNTTEAVVEMKHVKYTKHVIRELLSKT